MRITYRWPETPAHDRCPECGEEAVPGGPDHRPDCRFFVFEDEQSDEPVTVEDWVRASTGWRDHDGFRLRPPVAA